MTDEGDSTEAAVASQDRAREVLVEVASEPSLRLDHPTMATNCDISDLETIVSLAWRHQFSSDRFHFKREMRQLQQFVCQKVAQRIQE